MHLSSRRPSHVCFHGIGEPARGLEPGEDHYWVRTDTFLRILDAFAGRPEIAISFDDGNSSDHDIAGPALIERGLRAEFFVLADRIHRPGSLDRQQIRELASAGMSIGSHGMFHRSWRAADNDLLDRELTEARTVIAEAAGRPVDTAACPLGLYDRRVLQELRRRGYRRVMTSDRAVSRPEAWLQPRFSVTAADTAETVLTALDVASRPVERLASAARITLKRLR